MTQSLTSGHRERTMMALSMMKFPRLFRPRLAVHWLALMGASIAGLSCGGSERVFASEDGHVEPQSDGGDSSTNDHGGVSDAVLDRYGTDVSLGSDADAVSSSDTNVGLDVTQQADGETDGDSGGGCDAGASCPVANLCHVGTTTCTGCMDTGQNQPNGTPCGSGQVCSGGSCVACMPGSACTPTNHCHGGTLSCATGMPSCTDTGTTLPNGTDCGTNMVCNAGSCVACTANSPCTPATCKTGATSCATGAMVCVANGNVLGRKLRLLTRGILHGQ